MGGGGKKGGKKSSRKKKTYTKAQKMAQKRIAAKKTAPKSTKTKSTPASTGRAPSKVKTKAQQMATARKEAGKTISSVKAANKQSMTDAAKARHAKFKQTGVQTFGGKKTNFSKAEQKRISDAGYSVAGYSKAPFKSETQLQVDRDNKLYGNTFPSGGLNISEEGKKVAAAQLSEKKLANKELARLEKVNPGTANYIKSLPPNIQTDALIGGRTQAPGAELAIGLGTLGLGKMLLGGGLLGGLKGFALGGAKKGLGYKGTQVGFTGMGKTGFDAISAGAKFKPGTFKLFGKTFNKPQILGSGAYSSPSKFNVPGTTKLGASRYAGTSGSLGGTQTPGGVIQSIVSGKAPRIGFLESQAKVSPGMFDKGVNLANKISQGAYGKSTLANVFRSQMNTGIAPGGGIGSNITGANLGKLGIVSAGGLNLGGTGGVDSGEPTGSSTGRTVVTTDKDKNINYDVKGIAKDAFLGLADAATFNKFDFDNLGRPGDNKTFTQKFETFKKSPLQQAIISKQLGIDAKRIINEGEDAAKSLFSNYIGNIDASSKKGIRQPIAKFLKDVGSDDATAMAGRAIDAFGYDDPNFSNEPNKLTKFLSSVSPIPNLSEENVQDIRHTFNKTVTTPSEIQGKSILKNVPYTQALGFANRIVSGKLSDSTGEAMNQLGMQNVGGIDDAINLGMQINTNKGLEGTVANKRFGELDNLIQKYGPGKGQIPTLPSIIKGIGGSLGATGGGTSPLQIQGGSGMTATVPVTNQQQQLASVLPVSTTQTGTDSSNLSKIMQDAYSNQMSLYGMNPNYFAQFMMQKSRRPLKKFKQVFNRNYF